MVCQRSQVFTICLKLLNDQGEFWESEIYILPILTCNHIILLHISTGGKGKKRKSRIVHLYINTNVCHRLGVFMSTNVHKCHDITVHKKVRVEKLLFSTHSSNQLEYHSSHCLLMAMDTKIVQRPMVPQYMSFILPSTLASSESPPTRSPLKLLVNPT